MQGRLYALSTIGSGALADVGAFGACRSIMQAEQRG